MNKSLVFAMGLCISSFVFLEVSFLVTERRPIARAAMGGIGIVLTFLLIHFAPISDLKRETNYQKFVFGLEIIILILWFAVFMTMWGMIQESLVESGYVSSDVLHYVPDSP